MDYISEEFHLAHTGEPLETRLKNGDSFRQQMKSLHEASKEFTRDSVKSDKCWKNLIGLRRQLVISLFYSISLKNALTIRIMDGSLWRIALSLSSILMKSGRFSNSLSNTLTSDKSCKVLTWIIYDFFQGTH